MNKQTKDEFFEKARKEFVYSLGFGAILAFYLDQCSTVLGDFFKVNWYEQDKIFKPSEIVKKEFFKKHILLPEEDKDGFGNQGGFYCKDEFMLIIVLNGDRLQEYAPISKLPLNQFAFVKIID